MTRDLLTMKGLSRDDIAQMLMLAKSGDIGRPLQGKSVAMIFEKPSARTRSATEMAVVQLGGHALVIGKDEVGIGTRESAGDVARTMACYHALIAARVMHHAVLDAMGAAVQTPVLNLLSDRAHPLQALADLLTIEQLLGRIEGGRIAWIGDASNVCASLAQGCAAMGAELRIASPEGFGLAELPTGVTQCVDPAEAVRGARIVCTDVWVSMGQSAEADQRARALGDYRVDAALMAKSDDAFFLHCLPARRGEEVTGEVIDGPQSAVWRQAENRMHAARGAIAWMVGA